MSSDTLRSAFAGAVFGAALTASRVYLPTVIINQMRLQDYHMLEVFCTASASSALIILAFDKVGVAKPSVRSNSSLHWFSAYDGNLIGGAFVGVGMSLTGACPGTVLSQLAQGIPSARTTALGGLLGGLAHAKFGKAIVAQPSSAKKLKSEPGPETIASKLNVSPQAILLAFEIFMLTTITFSALSLPGRSFSIMPTVAGGLLIGLAQAVSILFTSSPLGASAAYEQAGSYLWKMWGFSDVKQPPSPPKAIIFALGILGGSFAAGNFLPSVSSAAMIPISTLQALIGGFVLTFGARIAGGCTSGHGLSGLASLSFSSLVTTAAMFGGGVAVQMLRL